MTPTDLRERARRAALVRWSRIDPDDRAAELAEARRGLLRRFVNEADPQHELPADERYRRGVLLLRDYMGQLPRHRRRSQ